MLSEHDAGREEVRGLNQLGAGSGPLSAAETAELIDNARRFVPLLYAHIQKENNILYPMAQKAVSPEEFARLDASCAAFDQEIRERLDVAALKALAADLVDKYPSNSADLAVYGACGACSSAA
jgi:hemerythrin-like domain-containing protein